MLELELLLLMLLDGVVSNRNHAVYLRICSCLLCIMFRSCVAGTLNKFSLISTYMYSLSNAQVPNGFPNFITSIAWLI